MEKIAMIKDGKCDNCGQIDEGNEYCGGCGKRLME